MDLVHPYPKWLLAIKEVSFRTKLIVGIVSLLIVVSLLPFFFQYIEHRDGYELNDVLLNAIPPADVSIPVFTAIWSMVLLFIIRSISNPGLFILYLYGFLFLCCCRIITITLVPLNAPVGLISLQDPLSNFFYGTKDFITRDLFFSGHAATLCLFAFCFRRKWDKILAWTCTAAVAALVIVQHVHYSIDVMAAPLFTFLCYLLARKVVAIEDHHFDHL